NARAIDERVGGTDYRTALLAAEAELATWTGRLNEVLDLAEAGLAAFALSGTRDPSLAWLAALLLRALADAREDPGRARRPLAEAAEIAGRLGARPLADLVARFAAQARIALPTAGSAGASPPTHQNERGPNDLTAREAEVLRLVTEGWTNQQIAEALFITRKTASVHVSNIMGKLGASNRAEAAAIAHRLGMVNE